MDAYEKGKGIRKTSKAFQETERGMKWKEGVRKGKGSKEKKDKIKE